MANAKMWTSKLGNKYPLSFIHEKDVETQKELKRLRGLKECRNNLCADCGSADSSWASVTHGVFVCIVCSDVHRSVGTHVTKMKGCTGTYLWGPDEIEKMQTVGNRKADEIYGDKKVSPDASKDEKQRFLIDKYVNRCFASVGVASDRRDSGAMVALGGSRSQVSKPAAEPVTMPGGFELAVSKPFPRETAKSQGVQRAPVAAAAWQQASARTNASCKKADIPDSFFDDLFGDEPVQQKAVHPKEPVPVVLQQQEPMLVAANAQKSLVSPQRGAAEADEFDAFFNEVLGVR